MDYIKVGMVILIPRFPKLCWQKVMCSTLYKRHSCTRRSKSPLEFRHMKFLFQFCSREMDIECMWENSYEFANSNCATASPLVESCPREIKSCECLLDVIVYSFGKVGCQLDSLSSRKNVRVEKYPGGKIFELRYGHARNIFQVGVDNFQFLCMIRSIWEN